MNPSTDQPIANTPAANGATVPVWLIVVLFLLVYWGAVYFDQHGGWFDPHVYAPYRTAEELATYHVTGGPNPFEQGRVIYGKTCTVCHQPSGQGTPGTFPPLAGSDWVNEKDPGRIIRIVLQGFSGPGLQVKGQPFNTSSSMVPWNMMSDDDIAAVITYVRGNKDWGNNAPPVTADQVKSVRGKVTSHPLPFSPDEMMNISPSDL